MSLRMPQNLSTSPRYETGVSVLEVQILDERVDSLGQAGKAVETVMQELICSTPVPLTGPNAFAPPLRPSGITLIQREMCGMPDHERPQCRFSISLTQHPKLTAPLNEVADHAKYQCERRGKYCCFGRSQPVIVVVKAHIYS